jgi:hypothetical protein
MSTPHERILFKEWNLKYVVLIEVYARSESSTCGKEDNEKMGFHPISKNAKMLSMGVKYFSIKWDIPL